MKRKLYHDLSVNTMQVLINQVCGFTIFYVLSVFFSKNDFGEISWSLAVLLTAFSILSFGIDQLTVKKVAEGIDVSAILPEYIMHVLLAGSLFYGILIGIHFIFPAFHHALLLFLGIGKLMVFFSSPFKQLTNGLERFRPLLFMSICSNVVRSVLLVAGSFYVTLTLGNVVAIFIFGDICELVLSVIIAKKILKVPLSISLKRWKYIALLKEALPQAGVVIFTSAIARFDWIFLGIFASNVALAEYSFAFKAFEVASLPLLIIAPILVPRFTKQFAMASPEDAETEKNNLANLLRFEMIISGFLALLLNLLWIPVIDSITHNKYGFVNRNTIFILSACMPLLYLNNLLWTISFAKGRLKMIFNVFLVTFLTNVFFDIVLIPFFGGEGAALAYLIAACVQLILFQKGTAFFAFHKVMYPIFFCSLSALTGALIAMQLSNNVLLLVPISIFIFMGMLIITRQIFLKDWLLIKRIAGL